MLNFLTATTDTAGTESMMTTIVLIVVMFAIMYFIMIRPENKRKKEAEEMRSSVRNGDEIITIGGIVGTIVDVKEDKIVFETSADRVRIEIAKWGISSNETAAKRAAAEAQKAKEAKAKAKAAKKADN